MTTVTNEEIIIGMCVKELFDDLKEAK